MKNSKVNAHNNRESASTNKPDHSERALKTLLYAMLVGILAVLVYAIDSKSWVTFFTTMSTGVVVAASAAMIGGLLGFLFGIPRALQQASVAVPDPTMPLTQPAIANERADYAPNTNLEQISDWLTKILVGVGLTQLREIGVKLNAVADTVAGAMGHATGNRSFALSLILFFLIVGFIFAYLWTRLYLPGAFRRADESDRIRTVEKKAELALATSRNAQADYFGTGKGDTDEVKKRLLEAADVTEPGNPNDPWKGRFGGKSSNNDRQLAAEVKPILGRSGLYAIRLTVKSLHPDTNPLNGAIQFFLHQTFTDPKPVVPVGPNGVAELNLKAWGAFTVGALADDGQTKLELDLAELPDAPAEFRNR
jgi:hypothetical protein